MFPGRHPGSRSIEGLSIKTNCNRASTVAEQNRDRELAAAAELWRTKTKQNLAATVLVTLASVMLAAFAVHYATGLLQWANIALAVSAAFCTLISVTRRSASREAAHRQTASRFAECAAACRASVVKYEEGSIGDGEFQALLSQHMAEIEALKKGAERI